MGIIIIVLLLSTLATFSFLGIRDIINGCEIDGKFYVILSFVLSCIILVMYLIYISKPTAIDVYKGKTALEITYRDSISIDSVVVWKEQIK